jgi:hypothetical protein
MSGSRVVSGGATNGRKSQQQQGSRSKAMLLALGKGLPGQVLPQEKVVETYLQDSTCDDPVTRAKLERLCKPPFLLHFTFTAAVIFSQDGLPLMLGTSSWQV